MHVLITRRLTLRTPTSLDVDEIALWLSNWNVARMLAKVPYPYHRADAAEWIESLKERPGALVYTIHRERLIGVVAIEGDEPLLGYWLAEPWHGRGFMTEAAQALLAHGFATRGYEAVHSAAFIDNPASLRVQQKLGFGITGGGEMWCRPRNETVGKIVTRLTAAEFAAMHQAPLRSAA